MPSEQQLSDVLSEFASTMLTEFPIQGILDHLVRRIVDVMPITAAGVTLISPGIRPRYVAASDALALRFEQLQTELGEGPCVEAYRTGTAVTMPDLRRDSRFPNFTPRALNEGLAAVFTFPLHDRDRCLGALDLYNDTPERLGRRALEVAQTLANVASAYLLNAQTRADLQDAADRSRDQSLHDPLTGLANRTLLLDRLSHAVQRSRRSDKTLAILFVDLDQFKLVNDRFGHKVGDELLVAVANRLAGLLRPADSVARLSGDEFVILCEDFDGKPGVSEVADRISEALGAPYVLSTTTVNVTASVGIAFAGRGVFPPAQLLQDADAAMYQAKRKGGNRHQVIDLREQHFVERRHALRRGLQGADARGELRVEHQPIVNTADRRVTGVEALVRWAHPERGMVAPAAFIPLAEESGVIVEIGRWVLSQACQDRHLWQLGDRAGDLVTSVNVSPRQLLARDFASMVEAVLLATQTDPELLTLELTESLFLQEGGRAPAVFEELKRLGVLLALDDFGTGFSSLSYLKRFPFDLVKIDSSFTAELESDEASRAIASAIIELAHVIGVKTVAEGVENAAQYGQVAALGCDFCQGFYFARPMSAADFDAVMKVNDLGANPRLPVPGATSAA
jgi:diguanylate cyclase (GGDEF)-like protein